MSNGIWYPFQADLVIWPDGPFNVDAFQMKELLKILLGFPNLGICFTFFNWFLQEREYQREEHVLDVQIPHP
jgi:hypothetical protein